MCAASSSGGPSGRGAIRPPPAVARARQLVHGRFEPLDVHAAVLLWMCAAPPEVINGQYVTSVPHTDRL